MIFVLIMQLVAAIPMLSEYKGMLRSGELMRRPKHSTIEHVNDSAEKMSLPEQYEAAEINDNAVQKWNANGESKLWTSADVKPEVMPLLTASEPIRIVSTPTFDTLHYKMSVKELKRLHEVLVRAKQKNEQILLKSFESTSSHSPYEIHGNILQFEERISFIEHLIIEKERLVVVNPVASG